MCHAEPEKLSPLQPNHFDLLASIALRFRLYWRHISPWKHITPCSGSWVISKLSACRPIYMYSVFLESNLKPFFCSQVFNLLTLPCNSCLVGVARNMSSAYSRFQEGSSWMSHFIASITIIKSNTERSEPWCTPTLMGNLFVTLCVLVNKPDSVDVHIWDTISFKGPANKRKSYIFHYKNWLI